MGHTDVVTIFTDGACLGNPGAGGYAAIVIEDGVRREIAQGFRRTTNNRMEMMAAIEALASLSGSRAVRLHSDSQYLVFGMTKGWARNWRRKGWRRADNSPALNPDLWQALLDLSERHDIEWVWVRGHSGDPDNERCDQLSVEHAKKHAVHIDAVYESSGRPASH